MGINLSLLLCLRFQFETSNKFYLNSFNKEIKSVLKSEYSKDLLPEINIFEFKSFCGANFTPQNFYVNHFNLSQFVMT
jgi:hypothetical protein